MKEVFNVECAHAFGDTYILRQEGKPRDYKYVVKGTNSDFTIITCGEFIDRIWSELSWSTTLRSILKKRLKWFHLEGMSAIYTKTLK